LLMPVIAGDGVSLTHISYPLLGVMAVAMAVLFWMGRTRTPYAPLDDKGGKAVAAEGILFGTVMLVTSLRDTVVWLAEGFAPVPNANVSAGIERVALLASLLAGIVGGTFLITLFIGWLKEPYKPFSFATALPVGIVGAAAGILLIVLSVKHRGDELARLAAFHPMAAQQASQKLMIGMLIGVAIGAVLVAAFVLWIKKGTYPTGWLWLIPVLWAFARLARYNVVYATSVDIAPAVYEFFLYAVALLFLLATAQYMTGVQKPTKWLRPLAASTAVLAFSAALSRLALALWGQRMAVAYAPIPGAAEVGLGIFALALAGALAEAPVSDQKH
ncbi:MAG: hypothetical protein J6R77_00440, partial [Clostridia bacterium]|nr:hypothetical protein [Clostridia bacterium]